MSTTAAPLDMGISWNDIVLIFGIVGAMLILIALLLVGTGAKISIGVLLCLLGASIAGAVAVGLTVTYLNDGTSDYTLKLTASCILLVLGLLLIAALFGWYGLSNTAGEIKEHVRKLPEKIHDEGPYHSHKHKTEKSQGKKKKVGKKR